VPIFEAFPKEIDIVDKYGISPVCDNGNEIVITIQKQAFVSHGLFSSGVQIRLDSIFHSYYDLLFLFGGAKPTGMRLYQNIQRELYNIVGLAMPNGSINYNRL